MATVLAAAPTRKSKPVSRPDVAGWMTDEDNYQLLTELAERHAGLARCGTDDILSEIALALLEQQDDAPAGTGEIAGWVAVVAERVRDDVARRNLKHWREHGVGEDVDLAELAREESDENETDYEFCNELVHHEQLLRRRVARQLRKLSSSQQEAIKAKYFQNQSLNHFAADNGLCDSAGRTALMRAKRVLSGRLDSCGYSIR